jgi:hypothetical protein
MFQEQTKIEWTNLAASRSTTTCSLSGVCAEIIRATSLYQQMTFSSGREQACELGFTPEIFAAVRRTLE